MDLDLLIGSGRKIIKFLLPFIVVGIIVNILYPDFFTVGGPSDSLHWISIVFLIAGVVNWLWSAILIAIKVPKKELITKGPFSIVKHPLYVGIAFLVLPWIGFLLNTWLGLLLGLALYVGSKLYSHEEEKTLSSLFGKKWDDYCKRVLFPWV